MVDVNFSNYTKERYTGVQTGHEGQTWPSAQGIVIDGYHFCFSDEKADSD